MSGEITSFHAYLLKISEEQAATKAQVENLREDVREINAKLDDLKSRSDWHSGRQSVVSTVFGLIGGGIVTWLARTFST